MPGNARKDIVRAGEVATYHCWSRCVQRAFLCGEDPVTGRDFNYRRSWIEDLLAYQARVFAVDVGNYNLLSNHAHAIPRTRPDIAAQWSAEELALRWKMAWPEFLDGQWIREPTDQEALATGNVDILTLSPIQFCDPGIDNFVKLGLKHSSGCREHGRFPGAGKSFVLQLRQP